jgi:hypothetical protein
MWTTTRFAAAFVKGEPIIDDVGLDVGAKPAASRGIHQWRDRFGDACTSSTERTASQDVAMAWLQGYKRSSLDYVRSA